MKTTVTLLALLLSVFTIYAQEPYIQWQKTIGGSGEDWLNSIIQTSDGGFFLGGSSESNISGEKNENSRGERDYWVLKLDSNGSIEWQKTIGGSGDDWVSVVIETNDGGFLVGGTSNSDISGEKNENSRGDYDYWVIKLDPNGNIEWQKTYGGNRMDNLRSVIETNDGGYLLGGDSYSPISGDRTAIRNATSDVWLIKLDSSGAIVWQNSFDIGHSHTVGGLAKTNDGGFIISSYTVFSNNPHQPFWILKVDASGNHVWDKIIGGDKSDWSPKINQTSDGGYIVAGISDSDAYNDKSENAIDGSFDYWVLKLDETGNIVWDKTIGGSNTDSVHSISECADGSYLVSGNSGSDISGNKTQNSKGLSDFWVLKLNNVGIIEWQNTIGGEAAEIGGRSIQTNEGNFLTYGSSNSNISGHKTENSRGGFDFWIVKHTGILGLEENPFASEITLYPNPAKNILQLYTQDKTINQVNIYTITGSRVLQLDMDTVSPSVDVSSLASGVYFVQLYSGKNVALKKFVKE